MPGEGGGNVWDQTLVHLRSEFNRGQSYDRGSDHNIRSCVETFFSGSIQDGPIVSGDINASSSQGTDGSGVSVSSLGNQVIDSKYVFSTVGTLMGFTPSRNHAPLLAIEGGKIVSKVGAPNNVKDAA
jgi:hypothetical protein